MKTTFDQRDVDFRSLREKVDTISVKTIVIDTQLGGVVDAMKRVELALEKNQPKR